MPLELNLNLFSNMQGVVDLYTKIPDGAFCFGVTDEFSLVPGLAMSGAFDEKVHRISPVFEKDINHNLLNIDPWNGGCEA